MAAGAWAVGALKRLAARFFDGLVAATPGIARRFSPSKTVIVRNFPRVEELIVNKEEVIPYPERPKWVVYVGGIWPWWRRSAMIPITDCPLLQLLLHL